MQIEATVIKALPLESGVSKTSGNPWSKATIIVEVGSGTQYPKKVALSNMKKAEEFMALPIGSAFTFDIDVESREFNGKWFTNCSCYRWTPVGAQPQPAPTYAQPQGNPYAQAPQAQGDDSLPF